MKKIILISICVLLLGWGCDDPNLLKANWPTIGSVTISDVTETTANCTFTFAPVAALVSKAGIQYSTSGSFAEGTREVTTSSLSNGNVYLQITGLVSNTTYYYKAFISNQQNETIYSTVNQFKTVEYPKLEVSTNSLNFSASREEKTLQITSNQAWEVKIDPPSTWLTLSKNSGSNNDEITVTAEVNQDTKERTATITVRCEGQEKTISVSQSGAPAYLRLPDLCFDCTGVIYASYAMFTIKVESNVEWTVSSDQDWLTVFPPGGSNDGQFSVTIAANTTTSDRTATITVSGGGITGKLTYMQNTPYFIIYPKDIEFPAASASEVRYLFIESNIGECTITHDASGWLTVSKQSSIGFGEAIYVTATANTTNKPRYATITVTGGDNTATINVTQLGVAAPN